MKHFIILPSLMSLALAAVLKDFHGRTACPRGLHIFAARGTNETAGEGRLQVLSGLVEAAIRGSVDEAVTYPANVDFPISEPEGVKDLTQLIEAAVYRCPQARIVLAGYSQGGQVVSDVLGGGTFQYSPPLNELYRPNIVAAVVFGDPTRTKGASYNYGNGTLMGVYPRLDTTYLESYASVYGSWCTSGDPVCDDGVDINAHVTEVETWEHDAAKFIVNLVRHKK